MYGMYYGHVPNIYMYPVPVTCIRYPPVCKLIFCTCGTMNQRVGQAANPNLKP
jgi:hypothetical protein